MEARLRAAVARAVAGARYETLPIQQLEAMAGRRDADALLNAVPWGAFQRSLYRRLESALLTGLVDAAHAHASDLRVTKKATRVDADFIFSFDKTNPRAIDAVTRQVFDLITEVSEGSKQAIRELILRLFQQEGETPQSIARQIRAHIGLTRQQSAALYNRRLDLQAQVGEDGIDAARAAKLEDDYRLQLQAQRAETIARTEAMRASNTGQRLAWEDARNAGFLDANQQRVWLVTPDERLCPVCAPIPDSGPKGLDEPFTDGDGGSILEPPAHPNCRCTTALYFGAM